jgi:hypothetical protein
VLRKILGVLLLFLVFLPLVACDPNRELSEYKTVAKEALDFYVAEKGQDNYSEEGWTATSKALTEGNQAIEASTNKESVDTAVEVAKNIIDMWEVITLDDFSVSMTVDKTTARIGDKITINVTFRSFSEQEVLIEIPDWLANRGLTSKEDILVVEVVPENSEWGFEDIAVIERPRITLEANCTIQRTFIFDVLTNDTLKAYGGAFFYVCEDGNQAKRMYIEANTTKIFIDEN